MLNQDYWDAGYEKGQEFSKGMAAARRDNYWSGYGSTIGPNPQRNPYRYAVGIDYVPYDNFPALLHQGERVQTAVEARSERPGMSGIQISMYGTTIREDADIDRVAEALLRKVELAATRG